MLDPSKRSSYEKLAKVDNSCPKSFQKRISNPLENLVTTTLEDELNQTPLNQRGSTDFKFENLYHIDEPLGLISHSNSHKKLDTVKSYENLNTHELIRAANQSMLSTKLRS